MSVVAVAQGEKASRGSHKLRALRHQISEFGIGSLTCTAWHPRLQVVSASCDNVSLGGICLRVHGAAHQCELVQVGDRLIGVHTALASGEVISHCDAQVRHCRSDGSDLLIGLQLLGGAVDLPLLYERQTRNRFAGRLDEAERVADARRILPAFKEWVSDLRNYLERMRAFLDREESALSSEDLFTYQQICGQYLGEVGPRIVQRVHEASHSMAKLLAGLNEDEHAAHRAYAQHHLGALFSVSPFIRRAQQKPLGYAGDYEMMNMLYRAGQFEGQSLFAKVINLCAVGEVAARANINRIGYLTQVLRDVVRPFVGRPDKRARIASIGCGPAREIEAVLESEPALGSAMDVVLLDQDARAISYCERKLSPLAQKTGAQLHFVRESARRLLCGGLLGQALGPRNLMYSAGLFDYLSDRSFSTLLAALYDAIAEGGRLFIGNVDVSNPTRYFMEYFSEWFLIHRSRSQLLEKARLLRPSPKSALVDAEPLGVNLFLVVEK